MKLKIQPLYLFLGIALTLSFAMPASALPIYGLTFQDVTFSIEQIDSNTLKLRIQNALDASGDWASAVSISDFQFKDMGTPSGGSATGAGTWIYTHDELNAGGCGGGDGAAKHCFDAVSPVALSNDMTWTIDFASGALAFGPSGPHLKVRFLNAGGEKQGSLLSLNLPVEVPEPATGLLLLSGLALVRFVARRRA